MKQSKLFPCYSIPLRDFLTSHGIRYELVGLHPETHKMFWVYIKDEKLKTLTSEWSKREEIIDHSFYCKFLIESEELYEEIIF